MSTLADMLDGMTRAADLVMAEVDGAVRCTACAHRCLVRSGRRGICQVRFNRGGELRVPWGYVAALQADPVEKKPFYHLLPGATALTFGMLGCDFHCDYCQNWLTSQALRDPDAEQAAAFVRRVRPEQVVEAALQTGAQVLVSSYNEPLITSEWAVDIFKLGREAGLRCAFVSNGNATPEALGYLRPHLDAYKIDLKSMNPGNYRRLGGVLEHVLESIQTAYALGLWVEVVTLVVPGFNDSVEELWEAARFLTSVSPDLPWHVSAFHPDYRMTEPGRTPAASLLRAAEIGREAGLRHVYAGNLPGRVEEYEHTACPSCGRALVRRSGYVIHSYDLTAEGACPGCGAKVAGVWHADPATVCLNGPGWPQAL